VGGGALNCPECKHYRENADHKAGTCHRYAPRPTLSPPMPLNDTYWPPVLPSDGCGDAEGARVVRGHHYPAPNRSER